MPIRRVLILGHSGFIGSSLERRLRREKDLEVVGLSPAAFDLTRLEDAARLAEHFTPETAVVMCSAIKRQAGDTLENYEKNTAMAANLVPLLRDFPVGRFLYFSSSAVYGEDVHDTAITEKTAVQPTSYYGMAKHASERLLLKAVEKKDASPLVILRPATIYGAGEPGRPYGPVGFLRAALAGETVTLWGDGSELREFLLIDDICEAVARLLPSSFAGTLNLVSGRSVSFQDVLAAVGRVAGTVKTESRPRSKARADHAFDPSLLRAVLAGFEFTTLDEGLKRASDAQLPSLRR